MKQSEQVLLASQQPGLIDTSTKRLISKSSSQFQMPSFQQQPVVTRRIHRKLVPMDGEAEETVVQPIQPPPQPIVHPVQQMIWPVAVQFNEDDALAKIREEKMLALLERQSEMLTNLLQKYKRLEEDQTNKIQRRIKELERENEEIWQRRRQNYLIYNVSQSVDQKLKEFNEFQMRPFLDQGQPVLLKPIHQDDRLFFDKKKKKPKPKKIVEVDDGLVQDPDTGELWDPKTGEVVQQPPSLQQPY
ncbi:unnamed protein product [Paramecium primaurelia]|uniref:Uncharacterized protein n=1 Tax=Paramecium primaurelia TaxID=5886 RepID=A0A8S1JSB1_PARPR|nr:unnamed protein product [Paramecium primaurelia]